MPPDRRFGAIVLSKAEDIRRPGLFAGARPDGGHFNTAIAKGPVAGLGLSADFGPLGLNAATAAPGDAGQAVATEAVPAPDAVGGIGPGPQGGISTATLNDLEKTCQAATALAADANDPLVRSLATFSANLAKTNIVGASVAVTCRCE